MAVEQENVISSTFGSVGEKLKLFEESRLKSFKNWKFDESEKCSASEMAKAGFHFIGHMDKEDDSAICFVCGKTLDGWEKTDEPWIEHKKHSANCKFVQMRRCEDDMTIEEWMDICKHVIKQWLTKQHQETETKFLKATEKIRNLIQTHQF